MKNFIFFLTCGSLCKSEFGAKMDLNNFAFIFVVFTMIRV